MRKKIEVTSCSFNLSELKGFGAIAIKKNNQKRIFLLRWREGIGRHREWKVLYDSRIQPGDTLITFRGKQPQQRWKVLQKEPDFFEVEEIKRFETDQEEETDPGL